MSPDNRRPANTSVVLSRPAALVLAYTRVDLGPAFVIA